MANKIKILLKGDGCFVEAKEKHSVWDGGDLYSQALIELTPTNKLVHLDNLVLIDSKKITDESVKIKGYDDNPWACEGHILDVVKEYGNKINAEYVIVDDALVKKSSNIFHIPHTCTANYFKNK